MSPGSNTEIYSAFAHIGLRENPGQNLNQVFLVLLIGVTTTAEESEITNKLSTGDLRYYHRWNRERRDAVVRSEAKLEDVELKDDRRVRTDGSCVDKNDVYKLMECIPQENSKAKQFYEQTLKEPEVNNDNTVRMYWGSSVRF
ncbi:hypothetical protein ANN_11270 [Periplaneta americana]|uniref:Uncharacterized protein n=1 Tax=Periplaneta americana TaxID=6978 RepID=A0ABQ8T4J3_PERAM|nr:hypothetical protein ANN_11270 [Periplaneta americana]